MTTDRQKAAVHFCERELSITFNGNIDSRREVSNFLGIYLDEAKEHYEEYMFLYEEALGSIGDEYFG